MKKYLKFIIYKHYILQSCNKKIQVFPPQLQPELLNMITRENNQLNKYSSMNEPKDTANSKSLPPRFLQPFCWYSETQDGFYNICSDTGEDLKAVRKKYRSVSLRYCEKMTMMNI